MFYSDDRLDYLCMPSSSNIHHETHHKCFFFRKSVNRNLESTTESEPESWSLTLHIKNRFHQSLRRFIEMVEIYVLDHQWIARKTIPFAANGLRFRRSEIFVSGLLLSKFNFTPVSRESFLFILRFYFNSLLSRLETQVMENI